MLRNNYRYSVTLLDHCQDNDIPFLYASSASVYGAGTRIRRRARERGAAQCLRLFEVPVRPVCAAHAARSARRRSRASATSTCMDRASSTRAGWPRSRSISFTSIGPTGACKLFEGSGGYAAGEQRRDFVFVDDVVKVNLDFLDHPARSGIFNLGTGNAETFNAVALATINACRTATASRRSRWPISCIRARSSTSRSRRNSSASTRASRRQTSRRCAPPGYTAAMTTVARRRVALRRKSDFGSTSVPRNVGERRRRCERSGRPRAATPFANHVRRIIMQRLFMALALALLAQLASSSPALAARQHQHGDAGRTGRAAQGTGPGQGPGDHRLSQGQWTVQVGRRPEARQGHRRQAAGKASRPNSRSARSYQGRVGRRRQGRRQGGRSCGQRRHSTRGGRGPQIAARVPPFQPGVPGGRIAASRPRGRFALPAAGVNP